jgi:hypothetical protein
MNNILQDIDNLIEETLFGTLKGYARKTIGLGKKAVGGAYGLGKKAVGGTHGAVLSGIEKAGELAGRTSKLNATSVGGSFRQRWGKGWAKGRGVATTTDTNLDLDKKWGRYGYGALAGLAGAGYLGYRKLKKPDTPAAAATDAVTAATQSSSDHHLGKIVGGTLIGAGALAGGKMLYDKRKNQNQNSTP